MNLNPMEVLNKARQTVPAVDYALALAGIAAAGSIIIGFIGHSQASVLLFGLLFIGMVLVFIFSRLIVSKSRGIQTAGLALMWLVLAFFSFFMLFTVTAVALGWPCNWADMLHVKNSCAPPVLIDGMAPPDAARILQQQGTEVASSMTGASVKLFRISYNYTQTGVIDDDLDRARARVEEEVLGPDDPEYAIDARTAESLIDHARHDLEDIQQSFSRAASIVEENLNASKVEAAKQALTPVLDQIGRFGEWCTKQVGVETREGYRVLIPLKSWPECQRSFRYELGGRTAT